MAEERKKTLDPAAQQMLEVAANDSIEISWDR